MIGDVIYESGKARRHHAQAVAPAHRAHLLRVRVQHVGVHAHRPADRHRCIVFAHRGPSWHHDLGLCLGRHAAVAAAHGVCLALRVQADAAGRAGRVLARSVPVRCGADLSHPGLRAPGGRLRTCRVLVSRLDYGLAPGRHSPRRARHQHDRHGLVHRADLWPASRSRHWLGRGLAHDVCRGRGPLSHRGRLPGSGVPGHAGG